MLMFILWIIITLLVASISAVIAKKYGPEYIIGMYAGIIVTANVVASKAVVFAYWTADAATIVYCGTFLLTDMLSEFYGKKEARKAVWAGFIANVMMVVSVWIAIHWEPAPFYGNQAAFEAVLGSTWRIVLASLTAYLISQNHDVWAYHFWKKFTKGKYLWLRNNLSTITSQLIDTVIFVTIAFVGVFPLVSMMIGQIVIKGIIAVLDTPYLYAVRWFYKMVDRKNIVDKKNRT